jgi:hypothetical protein
MKNWSEVRALGLFVRPRPELRIDQDPVSHIEIDGATPVDPEGISEPQGQCCSGDWPVK